MGAKNSRMWAASSLWIMSCGAARWLNPTIPTPVFRVCANSVTWLPMKNEWVQPVCKTVGGKGYDGFYLSAESSLNSLANIFFQGHLKWNFLRTPDERFHRFTRLWFLSRIIWKIFRGGAHALCWYTKWRGVHHLFAWWTLMGVFVSAYYQRSESRLSLPCTRYARFLGAVIKPAKNLWTIALILHYDALVQFIETLDLQNITLVVQDWGGLIGLPFAAHHPQRIKRLVIMNTGLGTGDINLGEGFPAVARICAACRTGTRTRQAHSAEFCIHAALMTLWRAYDAPFSPMQVIGRVLQQCPLIVPSTLDMLGAELNRQARDIFKQWTKPTLVMFQW